MDLFALFERVPHLLDACVEDKTAAVKTLRLVSKAASQVVLRALRSYKLNLAGQASDTNVNGARLLRGTHLTKLSVHLGLSGSYSPALLLEMFVREAGPSLSTIFDMILHLENIGKSAVTAAVLDTAIALLLAACPALTTLQTRANVLLSLIATQSLACPLLRAVSIEAQDSNVAQLQQLVNHIDSLLPHMSHLVFRHLSNHIPNMFHNENILVLELKDYEFSTDVDWLLLPPKLQDLECAHIDVGPPALSSGGKLLSSLLRLNICSGGVDLHVLTQVLQAAPALICLQTNAHPAQYLQIQCAIDMTTAADLRFMQAANTDAVREPVYWFACGPEWRVDLDMQSFITSLPCMTDVVRCTFLELRLGELSMLIRGFPNVQRLVLYDLEDLEDIELQVLRVCSKLSRLDLERCNQVSPMGLLALCQHLPSLCTVRCRECALLKESVLQTCGQLLDGDVSITEMQPIQAYD